MGSKTSDPAASGAVATGWTSAPVEQMPVVRVGPGCTIRDLPGVGNVRAWIVDMTPGSQWPYVDEHPHGEAYYVVSGEVIEGGVHHGAGTWVRFDANTRHRPRTETGVRLLGINPAEVG